MRILIVDDDFSALRAAKLILRDEETLIASDTESAVALARRFQPDAILVDAMLGEENGIDAVLPLLEASPASAIAVTSGSDSFKLDASTSGAHAWIPKSAWPKLPAVLSQILEMHHGEQRQLRRQQGSTPPPSPHPQR